MTRACLTYEWPYAHKQLTSDGISCFVSSPKSHLYCPVSFSTQTDPQTLGRGESAVFWIPPDNMYICKLWIYKVIYKVVTHAAAHSHQHTHTHTHAHKTAAICMMSVNAHLHVECLHICIMNYPVASRALQICSTKLIWVTTPGPTA